MLSRAIGIIGMDFDSAMKLATIQLENALETIENTSKAVGEHAIERRGASSWKHVESSRENSTKHSG